ncbi:LytTR family transcriptional regulator [Niastella yeongjuensis]|uniref:LytTR family transcriptional regulator n=1 Tax=Niastella yeongjuensis TaxID=354355 RepID=A0A1V9EYS1_9BACT|nr:response regulator [Niastella yeongjuensis]OQP51331.1 LytTR family transcriptional regulator [Niastella yeongjuensis]SEP38780.1 two component transcriptional regulator, LytTR family [Niastella yeongjuensis]
MIKCIIVDDEPLALDILEKHIAAFPQLQLVRRCRNALEAFDALHAEPIDLVFLDIQLPSISGIDFIRSLKEPPAVIFITAYAEYAITGFELEAIDYLLKPVTPERFNKSINKLLKQKQPEPVASPKDYTYFKVAGNLIKIMHTDLLVVKSVKDYLLLKTKRGNHLTHMTMKNLEALLPAEHFIRVHRSYLVNRQAITRFGRQYITIGEERIPIGENYRPLLSPLS